MERAVFLDRDNTIVESDGDLGDESSVTLIRGAALAIASLRQLGYRIIVVTNQGGVARGIYTEDDVDAVHQRIAQRVHEVAGGVIDRFYYCPFHPDGTVDEYCREHPWRKPKPGMLTQAASDLKLNLADSWMVGDQERDIEAGLAAGCQTILVDRRGRRSKNTRSHFQVETLGEAAAIIAQNRARYRELQGPIVITKPEQIESTKARKIERVQSVSIIEHQSQSVNDVAAHTKSSAERAEDIETDEQIDSLDDSALTTEPDSENELIKTEVEHDAEATSDLFVHVEIAGDDSESDDELARSIEEESTESLDETDEIGAVTEPRDKANEVEKVVADESTDPTTMLPEQSAEVESSNVRSSTMPPVPDHPSPSREEPKSADDRSSQESHLEPASLHLSMPAIQTRRETDEQTEGRHDRLVMDVLAEIRSWRMSQGEFTPIRMFAFVGLIFGLLGAIAAAIYLDGDTSIAWIGVAAVAELAVIGMLLLSPKG